MQKKRTHYCGSLRVEDVGKTVTLMGWVARVRDLGQLIFVWLRDREGIVQLVLDVENPISRSLHQEYVVRATGTVVQRTDDMKNPKLGTGEIEVMVDDIEILNPSETPPFVVADDTSIGDEMRLKYRYLDLRRPKCMDRLILRHNVARIAREYFYSHDFLEIETPFLIKSTPEGARDYLVPSRVHQGQFYALPQSPQMYKQLLMVGGFDRYMQIVRCFRDEDLRADRQPEFTQIDLEMSFVDIDDVIEVNEGFLKLLFKEILDVDLQLPLPRLSYDEAMSRFGSDKPDTRFEMELIDITDVAKKTDFAVFNSSESVFALNIIEKKLSRKEIDRLTEIAKLYKAKGMAWISVDDEGIRCPFAKFLTERQLGSILAQCETEPGDTVLIIADKKQVVFDALGAIRLELGNKFGLIPEDSYNLLWVVDFPLFEEADGRLYAKHHPFTAPNDNDIDDLPNARAKAYDIILNGVEIGGGSIRISDEAMQKRMFDTLGFTSDDIMERFGFLIEAFKYGVPPHGGMAYGLDRLVMLLAGCDSIRDVIAFPKVQNASELLSGAPSMVDRRQIEELFGERNDENDRS